MCEQVNLKSDHTLFSNCSVCKQNELNDLALKWNNCRSVECDARNKFESVELERMLMKVCFCRVL